MNPKVEFSTTYDNLGSIGTRISKSGCTATCTARGINYWIGTFEEDGGSESAQASILQRRLGFDTKNGPLFIPPSYLVEGVVDCTFVAWT